MVVFCFGRLPCCKLHFDLLYPGLLVAVRKMESNTAVFATAVPTMMPIGDIKGEKLSVSTK